MTASLFRREVVRHRRQQWLGTIRIARPLGFAWSTTLAAAIGIAMVWFSACGHITRKTTLKGFLLPRSGLFKVVAPQDGVVDSLLVREGDTVLKGQALAIVRSERKLASGRDVGSAGKATLDERATNLSAERNIAQAQALQRRRSLDAKLRSLLAEEAQSVLELRTVQHRVRLAADGQARVGQLAAEGYVSASQAQQKHEELLDHQLREQASAKGLESLRREILSTRNALEAEALDQQARQAQFAAALASLQHLAVEEESKSGTTIVAPRAGTVMALAVLNPGEHLNAGQMLLALAPHEDNNPAASPSAPTLEAHLFAPNAAVGFLHAGQAVNIRYTAFPFQKFGLASGSITAVGRSPISPDAADTGSWPLGVPITEPVFRILVRLNTQALAAHGRPRTLAPGMTLEADVLQERRTILEWLLEPLLAAAAVPGHFPSATTPSRP
jgi:membrane fusion protein